MSEPQPKEWLANRQDQLKGSAVKTGFRVCRNRSPKEWPAIVPAVGVIKISVGR